MNISFQRALPELPFGVLLRFCHLDDDLDIELQRALTTLSAEERDRAASFHFARDRERFVRARGFLRRELAAVLACSPEKLVLDAGPYGKPFVAGQSLGFNLSHSANLAVLAINPDGPVGIDLEALSMDRNALVLIDTCLTMVEEQALKETPTEALDTLLLACWTAKEAAVKLTGTGWSFDPKSVMLRMEGGMPTAVLSPPARLFAVPVPGHLCYIALPVDNGGLA